MLSGVEPKILWALLIGIVLGMAGGGGSCGFLRAGLEKVNFFILSDVPKAPGERG